MVSVVQTISRYGLWCSRRIGVFSNGRTGLEHPCALLAFYKRPIMELQELELPPEKDDDPMLAVMELGKGGWSESGDEIRWKHSNQLKTRMDDSKSIDETYARSSVSTLDELPCNPSIDELPCNPSQWPQRPLLVRATPNTNTRITGIRYCSGADFLDCDGFVNSGSLPINGGKEVEYQMLAFNLCLLLK